MKTLYERLDEEGKSVFDNARHTLIREMDEIGNVDIKTCVMLLVDAIAQVSTMQQIVALETADALKKLNVGTKWRLKMEE